MRNSLATAIALLPEQPRPVHGSVHTDRHTTDVYCGLCRRWISTGRDEYGFRVPGDEWLRLHEQAEHHAEPAQPSGRPGVYACADCPSQWSLESDGPSRHAFTHPTHRVTIREAT